MVSRETSESIFTYKLKFKGAKKNKHIKEIMDKEIKKPDI